MCANERKQPVVWNIFYLEWYFHMTRLTVGMCANLLRNGFSEAMV